MRPFPEIEQGSAAGAPPQDKLENIPRLPAPPERGWVLSCSADFILDNFNDSVGGVSFTRSIFGHLGKTQRVLCAIKLDTLIFGL